MSTVEWYPFLRALHVVCAATSLALFVTRGVWMLAGSSLLQRRWVKVLPHVVDTLLLASAIALAATIHQYPFAEGWLTAKVVALGLYVGLGTVALKRGRTRAMRAVAFGASLLVFGYIVAVAHTHTAMPWR